MFLDQASSDLSVLDFDIPTAFQFVLAGLVEIVSTIGIMAYVTWQVLIVGLFAIVSSKYIQVRTEASNYIYSSKLFFYCLNLIVMKGILPKIRG